MSSDPDDTPRHTTEISTKPTPPEENNSPETVVTVSVTVIAVVVLFVSIAVLSWVNYRRRRNAIQQDEEINNAHNSPTINSQTTLGSVSTARPQQMRLNEGHSNPVTANSNPVTANSNPVTANSTLNRDYEKGHNYFTESTRTGKGSAYDSYDHDQSLVSPVFDGPLNYPPNYSRSVSPHCMNDSDYQKPSGVIIAVNPTRNYRPAPPTPDESLYDHLPSPKLVDSLYDHLPSPKPVEPLYDHLPSSKPVESAFPVPSPRPSKKSFSATLQKSFKRPFASMKGKKSKAISHSPQEHHVNPTRNYRPAPPTPDESLYDHLPSPKVVESLYDHLPSPKPVECNYDPLTS